MRNWALCRVMVIGCWFLVSTTFGQENGTVREKKLEQVFNDDFSADTRADYEIKGDVAWDGSKLILRDSASVERAINGGPWAKLELDFSGDGWGAGDESQELKIWFLLKNETDCYVRLRRNLDKEVGRTNSVALFDIVGPYWLPVTEVVRELPMADGTLHRLTVEYRYGLVTVADDRSVLLTAAIANGGAEINGFSLQDVHGSVTLERWVANSLPALPALSAEQQRLAADATSAHESLISLYSRSKIAEAAEFGEHALKLREKAFGEEHPAYVRNLNDLAVVYQSMGKFAQAESLYLQARDILEKVQGKGHPEYATNLNNQAVVYKLMGEHARAEPMYLQAQIIWKNIYGEEHTNYAASLDNLANLYSSIGEYARAEPIYIRACDIYKKVHGEEHSDYATSLNNLAMLYKSMGDYARAEPLYLQAHDIWRKVHGERHHRYALSLNNLAVLYQSMGEFTLAERLYLQARDIRRETLKEDHPDFAGSLNNLANLYRAMGEVAKAEPLFLQAQEILKKSLGEEHPTYASNLNNLAILYKITGEYERAEKLHLQASDIYKTTLSEGHPEYAVGLNNLAGLYQLMDEYVKAEQFHWAAYRVLSTAAERVLPTTSAAQARGWVSKYRPRTGLVLSDLRRQQKWDATRAYEAVWGTKGMVDRLRGGHSLSTDTSPAAREAFAELRDAKLRLAKLVTATPSPKQADSYRKALAAASQRKETLEKKLAELSTATARELNIRDAKIDELIQQLPDGVAVIDFVQLKDWIYVDSEIVLEDDDGKFKNRIVKKLESQPVYDAFVLRSDRSTENPAKWIPLGPAEPIETAIAAWRSELTQAASSVESLKDPERTLRTLIWEKLESQLDGIHTVVIIPDGSLNRLPWAALPGRNEGEYLMHDYSLTTASSGQQLYGILTDSPIETEPGLLVVGGIEYDRRPKRSVTDKGSTLATVGSLVDRSTNDDVWSELPGTEQEATAIARLWDDRGAVTELGSTQADEHSLAGLLPKSRFVHLATHGFFDTKGDVYGTNLREQSMFESAMSDMQNQSSVAYRNPLLMTGIVMAGANVLPEKDDDGLPVGDDGILTAEEISSLDLRNTELVTLSACETGLGDVAAGEGVYGLTKALHKSGVRSVVASQWKVNDTATQELMRRFYENLWGKNQSRIEALRNAQLWMLEHPRELVAMGIDDATTRGKPSKLNKQAAERPVDTIGRTTPYFWAAFQLSGDWR